ncbi:phosphatidylglycerophosphatase and protein-tyrosine phosphatase 1-like isoform X1 [Biomphalaria glabrata]|uniref:Phosphatidylglycerophosphatase and protein-tyrosine phosphatase 1 n=1 Tax=Biomphalaria glabrata TaxID=6526 RepID=A0A9W2YS97_BIOGL|nr:phosphatidylglycerophosphatase and protein-tyrosine phosphatase 1-like isoform X1 [Biomphalaria glabrata]XP_055865576.1 phosphatidylglycerophosphatase and protein-tyrosine phosphatase 1-like isoform X1 [Biomphalaria glabrata]XP_055865577.1 phosphatidylglycerophosphatase and protein-tyrosine phosphatase 1-like isoform X1 [Biomphalaria glabrata]XP_055865578.1 phosphatidylglycerophosphatase and protein-tyrosine phosphatase 1-like isoform X1 [Biomphalaria glabrata]XP_055865579.1 phosphatidylglyc
MLARILFYPSLAYNYCMTKVSSRTWYNRIDSTVILGALPLKCIAQQVKEFIVQIFSLIRDCRGRNNVYKLFTIQTDRLMEEEKIKGIVSLNEDYELKYLTFTTEELKTLGIEHLRLSTVDFTGTPTQEKLVLGVQFLNKHRELGQSVYVHCKAGRTRSTTLVVCYLMQLHKWKPQEAVDFIKSKRPHILLRDKQLKSIEDYNNSFIDS